jgi:integrase/recombinase XerD
MGHLLVQLTDPGASAKVRHQRGGTIQARPAAVYLSRLARGSRRTLRQSLDAIAGWASGGGHDALSFPWQALRYEHTAAIRSMLAERYAVRTANKMLSALRGVLKEAWRLELMSAEEYQRAADVQNIRGTTEPRGRALGADELQALLAACDTDDSVAGRRDAALIAVGYGAGLRVAELVGLDLRDVQAGGRLSVRAGKGRKAASAFLSAAASARLAAWVELRGPAPGPLFVPLSKAGRLLNATQVRRRTPAPAPPAADSLARLSTRGTAKILNLRRIAAGLEPLTPHDLRRSMITHLLERTQDLALAQRRARHASPQTTALYDRRQEESDRRAIEVLDASFVPSAGPVD